MTGMGERRNSLAGIVQVAFWPLSTNDLTLSS